MRLDSFQLADGGVPRFAERCGIDERFRYWSGASGRRYLFTAIEGEELASFSSGVVLLVREDAFGAAEAVEAVSLAEGGTVLAAELASRLAADDGLTAYVHLLADRPAAQRALIFDLASQRRSRLAA